MTAARHRVAEARGGGACAAQKAQGKRGRRTEGLVEKLSRQREREKERDRRVPFMSQRVARGGMYLLAGSQLHEAADKSRIPDPVQFYIYRRRWCAQGEGEEEARARASAVAATRRGIHRLSLSFFLRSSSSLRPVSAPWRYSSGGVGLCFSLSVVRRCSLARAT